MITIFFCSFYLLNLVLAVVYLSYEKELQSLQHEVRTTAYKFLFSISVVKNRQGMEADDKKRYILNENVLSLSVYVHFITGNVSA